MLDTALNQLGDRSELTLAGMTLFAAKALSSEFLANLDTFVTQFKTFQQNANMTQLRLCPTICKFQAFQVDGTS